MTGPDGRGYWVTVHARLEQAGWLRRRDALRAAAADLAFDEEMFDTHALAHAADEGMTIATGDEVHLRSNGEHRDPSTVGDPA